MFQVRSELHYSIFELFKKEGIEIPFAQRDIWIRNPEALQSGTSAPEIKTTPSSPVSEPQTSAPPKPDLADLSPDEDGDADR